MFGYCFKIDFIFLSSTYASLKVYQWLQIGHSKHKLFKHLLTTHFYSLFWSLWKWKLSSLNTQSYGRMRWILGCKYILKHFHAPNYSLKLYYFQACILMRVVETVPGASAAAASSSAATSTVTSQSQVQQQQQAAQPQLQQLRTVTTSAPVITSASAPALTAQSSQPQQQMVRGQIVQIQRPQQQQPPTLGKNKPERVFGLLSAM